MEDIESGRSGPSCANCHFLMKWMRTDDGGEHKFEISRAERRRLEQGESPETVLGSGYSLACFQNVWDSANLRIDSAKDMQYTLALDRAESCFFFPQSPGMFFPAAVELERRLAERREARRDRSIAKWATIIGLVSAVLGAILGAVLTKVLS